MPSSNLSKRPRKNLPLRNLLKHLETKIIYSSFHLHKFTFLVRVILYYCSRTIFFTKAPLTLPIICKLRVTNRSDKCAVWKMKLKTPERFGVKPRCGVIDVGAEEIIDVMLQKPGPIEKPEVFRFESILVNKCPDELRQTQIIEALVCILSWI